MRLEKEFGTVEMQISVIETDEIPLQNGRYNKKQEFCCLTARTPLSGECIVEEDSSVDIPES